MVSSREDTVGRDLDHGERWVVRSPLVFGIDADGIGGNFDDPPVVGVDTATGASSELVDVVVVDLVPD